MRDGNDTVGMSQLFSDYGTARGVNEGVTMTQWGCHCDPVIMVQRVVFQ